MHVGSGKQVDIRVWYCKDGFCVQVDEWLSVRRRSGMTRATKRQRAILLSLIESLDECMPQKFGSRKHSRELQKKITCQQCYIVHRHTINCKQHTSF